MTDLEGIIAAEIAGRGPMRMDRYMGLCLMHPEHGYYVSRDPFGQAGDFVTAPEISQMFGEMIGLWLAQVWADQGRQAGVVLAELGPGRGTLMADILRVFEQVPGILDAISVVLVEQSPALRAIQKQTLAGKKASWTRSVSDLPDGPMLLVANEFFDALPVRQAERIDALWLERGVRLEGKRLVRCHIPLDDAIARGLPKLAPEGTVVEWSDASERIAAQIGARLTEAGGAALVIDYGSAEGTGDTIQAIRGHEYTSIFAEPGKADLTAHVNFGRLAASATPAIAAPLWEQGSFLAAMGIGQRAQRLAKEDAGRTADALERLTDRDQMGTLFKVQGLRPADAPALPVLEQGC